MNGNGVAPSPPDSSVPAGSDTEQAIVHLIEAVGNIQDHIELLPTLTFSDKQQQTLAALVIARFATTFGVPVQAALEIAGIDVDIGEAAPAPPPELDADPAASDESNDNTTDPSDDNDSDDDTAPPLRSQVAAIRDLTDAGVPWQMAATWAGLPVALPGGNHQGANAATDTISADTRAILAAFEQLVRMIDPTPDQPEGATDDAATDDSARESAGGELAGAGEEGVCAPDGPADDPGAGADNPPTQRSRHQGRRVPERVQRDETSDAE